MKQATRSFRSSLFEGDRWTCKLGPHECSLGLPGFQQRAALNVDLLEVTIANPMDHLELWAILEFELEETRQERNLTRDGFRFAVGNLGMGQLQGPERAHQAKLTTPGDVQRFQARPRDRELELPQITPFADSAADQVAELLEEIWGLFQAEVGEDEILQPLQGLYC